MEHALDKVQHAAYQSLFTAYDLVPFCIGSQEHFNLQLHLCRFHFMATFPQGGYGNALSSSTLM